MGDETNLRKQREEIVRRHMEAENVHDFDTVIATFGHPRYELIATERIHDGETAVREYFRETRTAFPDQRNELISVGISPGPGNESRMLIPDSPFNGEANADSTSAVMSADGRFITFATPATNIIPIATNGLSHRLSQRGHDGKIVSRRRWLVHLCCQDRSTRGVGCALPLHELPNLGLHLARLDTNFGKYCNRLL